MVFGKGCEVLDGREMVLFGKFIKVKIIRHRFIIIISLIFFKFCLFFLFRILTVDCACKVCQRVIRVSFDELYFILSFILFIVSYWILILLNVVPKDREAK